MFLTLLVSFVSTSQPGYAIPAFARKYGLPCSACHIGWPLLNNFGIAFKDNGYQLGNDKDSPIYQNPAYFPITFRVTPQWHLENTNKVAIDQTGTEQGVTTHGFDLSGLDIWTAGTLSKNISFQVLPSMEEGDSFHFESAWVRFDNLLNSPWLNVKVGKFELDNLLSEKRFLTLSGVGGAWFNYHFSPQGDINGFGGIGDNQLGVELSGHNHNSYSRYSISLLSSVDGNPGLTTSLGGVANSNTARSYDVYVNVNQGFPIKGLGVQRIGAYAYVGLSPTYYWTTDGGQTAVQAKGNRSFSRIGAFGWWFIKDLDVETFYMHGQDNVFLGNGVATNDAGSLPAGAAGPTWNGGFVEAHYTVNPQFIFTGRYELVHMSRQANPGLAATPNLGNVDSFTIGYRWYPIMLSRAGLAIHNEYSQSKMGNLAPLSGTDQIQRSVMVGFDFDY
ncbi:MAG TPA: hypothetical protein VK466_07510 [Terriglobales bacterium]|nr:hypothetical protein [Terriglobales bacterium]